MAGSHSKHALMTNFLHSEVGMKGEEKAYVAPQLAARANAVDATQLKVTGSLEPATMGHQFGAGDMGFGL